MPLIFSTYKLKLGGIVPTSNLFSKFLEKNVEESYDVYKFHVIHQAFWKKAAQTSNITESNELATSSRLSKAFPFHQYIEFAQHINEQQEQFGEYSQLRKECLFLPLWHQSSRCEHELEAGQGDYVKQATYDSAYKFYTFIGVPEYELLFDKSQDDGVLSRSSPAHPFYMEVGSGWDLPNDISYSFNATGNYRIADSFYSYLEPAQNLNFDFSVKNFDAKSEFTELRKGEPYYYEQIQSYQLTFKYNQESSFGNYGSYDPIMPALYGSGRISGYYQVYYEAAYSKFGLAQDFYYNLGLGQTVNFDFRGTRYNASSDFTGYGKAPPYHYELVQGQQLKVIEAIENAGFESYGVYDPIMPAFYTDSKISSYYQVQYDVSSYKRGYAVPFHHYKNFGYNIELDNEYAGAVKGYAYESYWFYKIDSNTVDFNTDGSGIKSRDRLEPRFHWYTNYSVCIPQNLFNTKYEAEQNSINGVVTYPVMPNYKFGIEYYDFKPESSFHSGYSPSPFFFYYKKFGSNTLEQVWCEASLSELRRAEPYFYFIGTGSFNTTFMPENATRHRAAYFDIIYVLTYYGDYLLGESKEVPEGKFTITSPSPFFFYFKNFAANKNTLGYSEANAVSFDVPSAINVAFYKNYSIDSTYPFVPNEEGNYSGLTIGFNPIVFFTNTSSQLVYSLSEITASANGFQYAEAPPLYTYKFTSNIKSELNSSTATKITYKPFVNVQTTLSSEVSGIKTLDYYQCLYNTIGGFDIFLTDKIYQKITYYGYGFLSLNTAEEASNFRESPQIMPYITKVYGTNFKDYWWIYWGSLDSGLKDFPIFKVYPLSNFGVNDVGLRGQEFSGKKFNTINFYKYELNFLGSDFSRIIRHREYSFNLRQPLFSVWTVIRKYFGESFKLCYNTGIRPVDIGVFVETAHNKVVGMPGHVKLKLTYMD